MKTIQDPDRPILLAYMHSDLTNRHKHKKELEKVLKSHGLLKQVLNIRSDVIANQIRKPHKTRRSAYLTRPTWKNPRGTRFFLFDGTEFETLKEAKEYARKHRALLIGENKQYDLHIAPKTHAELRELFENT